MSTTKTEKLMDVEEFLEKHADKLADLTGFRTFQNHQLNNATSKKTC